MPESVMNFLGLGAVLGSGIVAIVIVFSLMFVVFIISNVLSLMIGAKIANIEGRTFFKALVSAILIVLLGSLGIGVLGMIHPILGMIGVLLVPGILIKLVYGCSLGKAVIAYILNIIATIIAIVLIVISILALGSLGVFVGKKTPSNSGATTSTTTTTAAAVAVVEETRVK